MLEFSLELSDNVSRQFPHGKEYAKDPTSYIRREIAENYKC